MTLVLVSLTHPLKQPLVTRNHSMMRPLIFASLLISRLILPSLTYSVLVDLWQNRDCLGDPESTIVLDLDGDCAPIDSGTFSLMYKSNTECVLSMWADEGCSISESFTIDQDTCLSPGYYVLAAQCTSDGF